MNAGTFGFQAVRRSAIPASLISTSRRLARQIVSDEEDIPHEPGRRREHDGAQTLPTPGGKVVTPSGCTHTPIAVHQPVAVADQPSAKRSCRTQALSMTISAGSMAVRAASSIAGSESSSETTLR